MPGTAVNAWFTPHRWRDRIALALRAAACVALAGAAHAAQPPLERVASSLFVSYFHAWTGVYGAREGLWRFDPHRAQFQRVSPFFSLSSMALGDANIGTYLTATEDRLIVEDGPVHLQFDPVTGRLLSRSPSLRDPANRGWVVIGPAITGDAAAAVGNPDGIYGSPWCLYTIYRGEFPSGECAPLQAPGVSATVRIGTDAFVLRTGVVADQTTPSFVADLRSDPNAPVEWGIFRIFSGCFNPTSFDPKRGGLWLGLPDKALFYPIENGLLSREPLVIKRLPTAISTWQLDDVLYHPGRDRFFALARHDQQADLVSLDRDLNLMATHARFVFEGTNPNQWLPETMAALPGTLPAEYVQTIPAVAHAAGAGGSNWTSDLWLSNPSAQPTTARVRRVAAPSAPLRTIELPAHGSLKIPDVLSWVGGGPTGDGAKRDALVLTAPYRWGEQLVAATRTSTPAVDPALRARGGTVGHAIAAVPTTIGYSNHLTSDETFDWMVTTGKRSMIAPDMRVPGRYRHSIGVVNDSDDTITVTLQWPYTLWGADWPTTTELAGRLQTFGVPPHTVRTQSLEDLFPREVRDHWVPKVSIQASRPAIIWTSMVDNLSQDATFMPTTLVSLQGDDELRAAAPFVRHLTDAAGRPWHTDVYGAFLDVLTHFETRDTATPLAEDRVKAAFHPADPQTMCGGVVSGSEPTAYLDGDVAMPLSNWVDTITKYLGFPPSDPRNIVNWMRTVFPDVVHLFPPCASDENVHGALEIRTGSWMSGYTRTYFTAPDGGTYGDMLPLYPPNGWPVQHFAGIEISPAFEVKVGLYNGDKSHAITHRLSLYAADGTLAAQRELVLKPWESLYERIETVLNIPGGSLPNGTYGLTVLPLDQPPRRIRRLLNGQGSGPNPITASTDEGVQGRCWAFVSLVDAVTGDLTNWW